MPHFQAPLVTFSAQFNDVSTCISYLDSGCREAKAHVALERIVKLIY